ncbi:putative E3 ubiquitin-protein ligase UBR7 [Phoenix dactylifera]|uniref:E3 ubiquitin-protein ligase UBR7 n=1 Tax=Phoenix dactylifera TaxID=42345 RepID=A0A8B7BYI2_PHODC|nr:putative E3 ubiquitin-protein ligase UBR7 [Phoenix dactylifera]
MADAFKDDAEQTVTIGEYIEGLEAEELEADLVLGGDEGKECTYADGYMKRQAIFSCLTCVPAGNAGVCTACSLSCHDGHEVVELWTKRKFRCDCGNSKFGEFFCKLFANKDSENIENTYNHNFKGSYCTCSRPYPDPDAKEQVEMIQCCICEDWFHENHLGLNSSNEIPRDEEGEPLYEDCICQECAVTCSFLKLYPACIWATLKQKSTAPVSSNEGNVPEDGSSASTHSEKIANNIIVSENLGNCSNTFSESETVPNEKNSFHGESTAKDFNLQKTQACDSNKEPSPKCILEVDINSMSAISEKKGPMFLSKKWRDLLCRCSSCCGFYAREGIDYLIDREDSIEEYEKMAKRKRDEKLQQQEGAELDFLNTLNHVQKIEILSGIADMKNEFQSFLESFDSSKPVTSADIRGVFENLAKKKKQRLL